MSFITIEYEYIRISSVVQYLSLETRLVNGALGLNLRGLGVSGGLGARLYPKEKTEYSHVLFF